MTELEQDQFNALLLQNERMKEDIEERSEAASLSNKDKRNLVDKIIQLESEKQELIAALKYAEGAFPDRFPNAKQMLRSLLSKHSPE
jgi:acetyl-CoA carboxylase carboxyltransferase component